MSAQLGATDCEQARPGLLTQPINAVTSLAFIPAGLLCFVPAMRTTGRFRLRLAAFAGSLVGVGIGSFAYHGPQPPWAGRAHDGSIVLAVACALLVRTGRRKPISRTRHGRLSVALTAAALAAYAGGRTGSPLCDPHSAVQLHGAWHVLTAGSALAFAWATAATSADDSAERM